MGLAKPIRPSEFVLQHAPVSITVDEGRSAPRHFRVFGRVASKPVSEAGVSAGTEAHVAGSWVQLLEGEYLLKDVTAESSSLTPHMQSFKVYSLSLY